MISMILTHTNEMEKVLKRETQSVPYMETCSHSHSYGHYLYPHFPTRENFPPGGKFELTMGEIITQPTSDKEKKISS